MPFSPFFERDLGPITNIQELSVYLPPESFNQMTANRNTGAMYTNTKTASEDEHQRILSNVRFGTAWDESDLGVEVVDGGYILMESDGLGGFVYSGYDLLWSHKLLTINYHYKDGQPEYIIGYTGTLYLYVIERLNPLNKQILFERNFILGKSTGEAFAFDVQYVGLAITHEGKDWIGFGWGSTAVNSITSRIEYTYTMLAISKDWFKNSGYKVPTLFEDPNDDPDNPPDEEEGGGGGHNKPDNPIPKPGLPSITAAAAGFLTLYKLTPAEMSVFADDCLASDAWEAIKLLFANPMEFIVGCSIVPFTPPGNTVWKPKFGAVVFPHWYTRIDNQYIEINCGDLYIEPFGKNFLDYAPFTRITIYLPYIGFRELDVNEIMGKTINVTYHCDCLSGDCIAFISTSLTGASGPQIPKVLATFNGNCACQVPFASQSFNSLIASSVNMLANVASSVVKGDLPAVSGSGVVGALEALGGDVQKSGSIGSSNGYMGVQIPYLIKHIPKDSIPSAYRALKGYPSNISGILGSFSGYAEIDNIDLTNISTGLGGIVATSAELEEIQTLLRGGVFI